MARFKRYISETPTYVLHTSGWGRFSADEDQGFCQSDGFGDCAGYGTIGREYTRVEKRMCESAQTTKWSKGHHVSGQLQSCLTIIPIINSSNPHQLQSSLPPPPVLCLLQTSSYLTQLLFPAPLKEKKKKKKGNVTSFDSMSRIGSLLGLYPDSIALQALITNSIIDETLLESPRCRYRRSIPSVHGRSRGAYPYFHRYQRP
ncbi:hypothetical protein GE09DRAFT_180309 [Coniochaeta sp. 2T2.1]|nr:hypothetical protein GE09DRAFT_180309 [Coniochaeta sp. 2T2.1]